MPPMPPNDCGNSIPCLRHASTHASVMPPHASAMPPTATRSPTTTLITWSHDHHHLAPASSAPLSSPGKTCSSTRPADPPCR